VSESEAGVGLVGVRAEHAPGALLVGTGQTAAGTEAVLLGLALVDCLRQHLYLLASAPQ